MISTPGGLLSMGPDGVARILLHEPRRCGCGAMAYFVINRDGKTRCIACDVKYQRRAGR